MKPIWVLIARYILHVNFNLNLSTLVARYITIILFVCTHFIFRQWFVLYKLTVREMEL